MTNVLKCGVENVYLPVLIPGGAAQKESDHMGDLLGVAWVTHGGLEDCRKDSHHYFWNIVLRPVE